MAIDAPEDLTALITVLRDLFTIIGILFSFY